MERAPGLTAQALVELDAAVPEAHKRQGDKKATALCGQGLEGRLSGVFLGVLRLLGDEDDDIAQKDVPGIHVRLKAVDGVRQDVIQGDVDTRLSILRAQQGAQLVLRFHTQSISDDGIFR